MASMEEQQFYEEVVIVASSPEQETTNANTMVDQDLANPEEEDKLTLFAPQPLNYVVDPDLINKIALDFKNQLDELLNRMKAENPLECQNALALAMVPATPVVRPENAQDTPTSVGNKRGRKQNTTLVGEMNFSFEPPKFCIEEDIDLDKVLKPPFWEESGGNHVSNFSAIERMQNWKVERRKRSVPTVEDFERARKCSTPTHDFYYYHLPSQLKLRTRPLVYKFLLDGTYSPNSLLVRKEAEKLVEVTVVDNQGSSSSLGKSSKRTYSHHDFKRSR